MEVPVEIYAAPDMEGLAQKLADSLAKRLSDGYEVVGLSHACDTESDEWRWSAVVLYLKP